MRRPRFFLNTILGVVVGTGACSGDPTTPTGPEPSFLLGDLNSVLLSCSPLPYAKSSATIGPNGGVMTFGPHALVVAPNALSQPVTITAEVVSGTVNSVRFSPEGLTFGKPGAGLSMSYSNCSGLGMLLPKKIAYTNEGLAILELISSFDLSGQKQVTGQLKHFSRYAVAY
jgi:hypothetical protein